MITYFRKDFIWFDGLTKFQVTLLYVNVRKISPYRLSIGHPGRRCSVVTAWSLWPSEGSATSLHKRRLLGIHLISG